MVLIAVIAFVLQGSKATPLATAPVNNQADVTVTANPVDQVSSADIALTVARTSSLPETTAITNQAQSAAADSAVMASSDNVVAKPQVIGDILKSNADIENYTSVAGDTAASLAAKFGVTSSSILWSNSLTATSTINPGMKLLIPPVNGIVYKVQSGDTPQSLATRFSADPNKIIAYNDAENGLQAGEQIIIPDATQATVATVAAIAASTASSSLPWGSTPIYGYNGYDRGYCTWYVASQISVPANWGNAESWAHYAALSGWDVSKTPTVGSIAQLGDHGGYLSEGHVAIVDAVSADGTQIQFRDMNGVAGFNHVGYSGWVPISKFDNYITR